MTAPLTVAVRDRALNPVVGAPVSVNLQASGVRLHADLGVPFGQDVSDFWDGVQTVPGAITQALTQLPQPWTVVLDGVFQIDRALALEGLVRCGFVAGRPGYGFERLIQTERPATYPRRWPYYAYLRIDACEGFVGEGLSIFGPEPWPDPSPEELAVSHALVIAGACRFVTFRNTVVRGVHGDFLTIAEDAQNHPVGTLVEDFDGDGTGRQMIAVVGGLAQVIDGVWTPAVTVRRFTLRHARRSGLDVEPSNAAGASGVVLEDGSLLDTQLYSIAGGGNTTHHDVFLRRLTMRGRLGPVKYGPPVGTPPGTHRGLVFEDVTYEPQPGQGGSPNIFRTLGIRFTRCQMATRGQGEIGDEGVIEDTTFTSVTSPPPSPIVCLRGAMTSINSTGVGSCV